MTQVFWQSSRASWSSRYETTKALRRAGAFTLLVEHNASRLKNRTIAVDDVNNTFHSSPRGRLARRSRSSELHFREAVPGHFETDQRAEPSAHGERRASIHGSDHNIAGIPDKLLNWPSRTSTRCPQKRSHIRAHATQRFRGQAARKRASRRVRLYMMGVSSNRSSTR